ncbi:MAG: TonB family protein [Gammaproteobacteria bacterium]|nr:MAG: TonB family protein [Gammaproteobacteria bacterium]
MSRGRITISGINSSINHVISCTLLAGSLISGSAALAEEVVTEETWLPEQELTGQEALEPSPNPFGAAANAPAATMALPNRRDESGTSIEDILEELDPDLEQIEAQIDAGEYEIPKYWLTQKIQEIEDSSHRFDPALVRPITLLGDIQVLEGNYVGALDNYGRAVHLERVNSGLVSAAQLEIVYREAEVYRTLGDFETANEREEYAYHVLQRAYDPYSEDLLPGLFHLAEWYEQTHNIFAARHLYQRATDVMVANGKGQTMEAIPAWSGVARTYRLERFPPIYIDSSQASPYANNGLEVSYGPVTINNFPAGERALQTIIQIHRAHHSPTPVIAQAILDLADWHLLFEKTREAYPLYEIAYELMEGVEGFPMEDFFGQPKMIHFPAPIDPSAPEVPEQTAEGLVTLQFDVTERGSARRLTTLESVPEGMMDFRVRKSIRAARFRPPLVNGEPQLASGYVYTHKFVYYPQVAIVETTEDADQ